MSKKNRFVIGINEDGFPYVWGPYKTRKAYKILRWFEEKYPEDNQWVEEATPGDPRKNEFEDEE